MKDDKNNSGNYNSGHRNSGDYNSGHYNSGNGNSGAHNSGNYNSGHRNSGEYNSGPRNSGKYNSGKYNSGFFNTDSPTIRMFNKDTGLNGEAISIPYIDLKLTEWIEETDLTDQQKLDNPTYTTAKGALIRRTYHEAWELYWSEISADDRQKVLDLPNFDAEIFREITGIDVNTTKSSKEPDLDGQSITLHGQEYVLTKKKE